MPPEVEHPGSCTVKVARLARERLADRVERREADRARHGDRETTRDPRVSVTSLLADTGSVTSGGWPATT